MMNCPKCGIELGQLKKYQIVDCSCGEKLMLIEINKKKELIKLEEEKSNDKN